jgi:nucleoredoxin
MTPSSCIIGSQRLYFSAQWCPPCRRFTPLLGEAYSAHKQYISDNNINEQDVEVIFVSLDSGKFSHALTVQHFVQPLTPGQNTVQNDFDAYRSKMPFYSVPFANLWLLNIKELSGKYGIRSIPTLVILNGQDGTLITKNGKGEYSNYFKGEYEVPSSCCIS